MGFGTLIPPPEVTEAALANPGQSQIGIYTLTHPRLYYIMASYWLQPWLGIPIEGQLFIVRFLGVLLNLVIALAAYKTAEMLFDDSKWIAPTAMAFVVFHPGNSDIMSAVNNDVLVNLIGALFFFTLARIYKKDLSVWNGLILILLVIAGILAKTTAVILLATLPFALAFYLWLRGHKVAATVIGVLILISMLTLFVILPLVGMESLPDNIIADIGKYFRVNLSQTLEGLEDAEYTNRAVQAVPVVFKSFWVSFGWRHIWLAPVWYWILGGISALTGVGILKRLVNWVSEMQSQPLPKNAYLGFAFFAALVAALIAVLRSLAAQGLRPYLSHGRYAFIAIIPFAIIFIHGVRSWMRDLVSDKLSAAFLASFIAFDAIAFWGYLVPFYYANTPGL